MVQRDDKGSKSMQITLAKGAGIALSMLVAGCANGGDDRADTPNRFDAISPDERLTLAGTEPFWSMAIEGDTLTYSAPDLPDGETIQVDRFAGNNGLGFTGELQGRALQIAVSPGLCSDGMSDQEFAYTVTAVWGEDTLYGCGEVGDVRPEIED